MDRNPAPTIERSEQAVDGRLQRRRVVANLAGFAEHLVDDRVELNDASNERTSLGLRVRQLRSRESQHAGKSAHDLGRQIGERPSKPPLCAAEIGAGEDDAGAHDPNADLTGTRDRKHEDVWTSPSGRAEVVGGDNRRGIAGERRRVGREVADCGGDESAETAPQGEEPEKGDPILGKARGQDHDHRGADHGADHPEPALAQRSSELGLTDNRR